MGDDSSSMASLVSLESGETCSYLQTDTVSGCRAPRSCSSCLEISECMIGASGRCVNQADEHIDPTIDFKQAITSGLVLPNASASVRSLSKPQVWQFPAGRITYCNKSDEVCRACRRVNFWRSSNAYPDSRFCLGANGVCVCIDACERPTVRTDCSTRGDVAAATSVPAVMSDDGGTTQAVWHSVIGALIFMVVAVILFLHVRTVAEREARRRRQNPRREPRHSCAEALGVNPLSLSGWEKYRKDLIDKETARLENGEETVNGRHQENDNEFHDATTAYVRDYRENPGTARGARVSTTTQGQTVAPASAVLAPLTTV